MPPDDRPGKDEAVRYSREHPMKWPHDSEPHRIPNLVERMENLIHCLAEADNALNELPDEDKRALNEALTNLDNAYGIAGEVLTMIDGKVGTMDPVANIIEQRELAHKIQELEDRWNETGAPMDEHEQTDYIDWAGRLAELVLALDEWRRKGGFDPYDPAGE